MAIGNGALGANASGGANTAVGVVALNGNSTANNNTAVGWSALNGNNGAGNVAIGYKAGTSNTSGSNNTFVGDQADASGQFTNATAIGANATVGGSNALVLGGTGANAVKVGIGTATPAFTLDVNGTANIAGVLTASSFSGSFGGTLSYAVTYLTPANTNLSGSSGFYFILDTDAMLVARTDTFDPAHVGGVRLVLPSAATHAGRILLVERKGTTVPFGLESHSGDLINGSPTFLFNVNNTAMLVSDGIDNWMLLVSF